MPAVVLPRHRYHAVLAAAARAANNDGVFAVKGRLVNWSWRPYERLVDSGFLLELEPPTAGRRWPPVRWYRVTETARAYLKAYEA